MDDGSAERSGGERVQQVCVGKENSRSRRLGKGEVRVELRSASGDLGNGVVVGGGRERGDGGEDRHLDKKVSGGSWWRRKEWCVPLLCTSGDQRDQKQRGETGEIR